MATPGAVQRLAKVSRRRPERKPARGPDEDSEAPLGQISGPALRELPEPCLRGLLLGVGKVGERTARPGAMGGVVGKSSLESGNPGMLGVGSRAGRGRRLGRAGRRGSLGGFDSARHRNRLRQGREGCQNKWESNELLPDQLPHQRRTPRAGLRVLYRCIPRGRDSAILAGRRRV